MVLAWFGFAVGLFASTWLIVLSVVFLYLGAVVRGLGDSIESVWLASLGVVFGLVGLGAAYYTVSIAPFSVSLVTQY